MLFVMPRDEAKELSLMSDVSCSPDFVFSLFDFRKKNCFLLPFGDGVFLEDIRFLAGESSSGMVECEFKHDSGTER